MTKDKLKITDKLLALLNYNLIIIQYLILFSCFVAVVLVRNNWLTWFVFLLVSIHICIRLFKIKDKMEKINKK